MAQAPVAEPWLPASKTNTREPRTYPPDEGRGRGANLLIVVVLLSTTASGAWRRYVRAAQVTTATCLDHSRSAGLLTPSPPRFSTCVYIIVVLS